KSEPSPPGLGIRFRIFEGEVDLHGSGVNAPHALHHVQLIAVRMACAVDPAFVVDPDGVDNESVALPLTDRVSKPRVAQVGVMRPSVSPDLTDEVIKLVDQHHPARALNDLHGKGLKINPRRSRRKTADRV